jgi:hypothetical protein
MCGRIPPHRVRGSASSGALGGQHSSANVWNLRDVLLLAPPKRGRAQPQQTGYTVDTTKGSHLQVLHDWGDLDPTASVGDVTM